MLVRYTASERGERRKLAEIYTAKEHNIEKNKIDLDAISIIGKLQSKGHQAFIVGGAVRDLMINKKPKDFDIVTDALPRRIRKIFWNSRVIGKRFRLVHVHYGDKIIEVSTFRSASHKGNNVFGSMGEDALRRDFTINALYYCPIKEQIIDYVGGFKDFSRKKIRSLIDPEKSFKEDPFRMIRAVKYSAMTGFKLTSSLQTVIKRSSTVLRGCSSSRMTEEVMKILQSGYSESIVNLLEKLNLFEYVLPGVFSYLSKSAKGGKQRNRQKLLASLSELDALISEKEGDVSKGMLLSYLIDGVIESASDYSRAELFQHSKKILHPITPPNIDVQKACVIALKKAARRPVV